MISAIAALGASVVSSLSLRAVDQQVRLAEQGQQAVVQQLGLAEQTLQTQRFATGIEQLGDKSQDVRVGGIYTLGRIAKDSAADTETVLEVLSAYTRTHSRAGGTAGACPSRPLPIDIQAALKVLGRRRAAGEIELPIDLHGACLDGARLDGADLRHAALWGASLRGAWLLDTDLRGAYLTGADLTGADLTGAKLAGAYVDGLRYTSRPGVDLSGTIGAPSP